MSETTLVWLVGLLLVAAIAAPFVWKRRRTEKHGVLARAKAIEHGLHEPVSLHPVIDTSVCAGCGACVSVCPEGDVLALINGQAAVVAPARCVGHGMCERSCPTEAIRLVFGTATRGVELPRIRENYETNVPGLYIVGELGGMGLVWNAFEQGRQCLEGIAAEARAEKKTAEPSNAGGVPAFDLLVVGSGPAGLSATVHAKRLGLTAVTVEKEPDLGGTVRRYPRKKLVMTRPVLIPGYGKLPFKEVSKEELIAAWDDVVETLGIRVQTGETVTRIRPEEGSDGRPTGFLVTTSKATYRARRVVLAIGRRGVPRKLGVPGEEAEGVYYSLAEPEHFAGRRVLVVGGGDSAVEAAMMLADQPGTTVHLSYRKDKLARIKPGNATRFEAAVAAGRVTPLWETTVQAIAPDVVTYADASEAWHQLPNDDVFVFIGGELPTAFLQACGIGMDTHFGTPRAA